jgi:hypothetical protein
MNLLYLNARSLYLNTRGHFAQVPHALADLSHSTRVCLAVVTVPVRRGKRLCRNGFFSSVSVISEICKVIEYTDRGCTGYSRQRARAAGGVSWGEPFDFSLSHCDKHRSPSAAAVSCASLNFEVTGTARPDGRQKARVFVGGAR